MLGRFLVLTNNHCSALAADVCYGQLMSSEILSIAFHVHISPAQLAILRFVPLIFSANPFLNSFQFLLRVCLPRGVSTCTWMNLQTELAKTNLDKKLQIDTDL